MSELVISAAGFNVQPLANLRDGPAELRWWYSRSFLDSDGTQVNWGTGTTGFWVTTPCSIADGLVTVDQDTLLWTTDDAQDPAPASIFVSVGLFTVRGQLVQQFTITGKAQFVVPSSLSPTTTWENFSAYNSAVQLANPPVVFYTAAQTDALVDRAFDEHPATDVNLGTVLLTVPADIPATPVVWGANDPLVRDATKIQGVDVVDTPPLDTQVLVYNQANNQYEPGNQGAGSGNVTSNEVVSVDGEVALFSGTGGKTIDRATQTGVAVLASGVLSAQDRGDVLVTTEDVAIGDYNDVTNGMQVLIANSDVTRYVAAGDWDGLGNSTYVFIDDLHSQISQAVHNTAPNDTFIFNGTMAFYLDQAANKLKVRVRYSDGTFKTGEIALT